MPYDKIDQLYDALKKDGAVSKSREHFRNKMLAPGKEGYQNRLQLYNALKADGAVDSQTYEEFRNRLGLHAVNAVSPNQSAGTKVAGGHSMSAAEKQQMMGNATRLAENAKAIVSDARKRIANQMAMVKKPFNTSFRIGENKNVREKGYSYNPNSGKLEKTYVTTLGNEYDSRYNADQEQRQIDQLNHDSSLGGQLENAYAERERLDEALTKRKQEIDKGGNKLTDFLRELAGANSGGPMASRDASRVKYDSDSEYQQLMAAARKNHTTIQLLEDKKNNKMNEFWHNIGATMLNGYTFSDGLSEIQDNMALQEAEKHLDSINKKRAKGEKLTREEQNAEAVLKNFATDDAMQGLYGDDYGVRGRAGKMFATSIDYGKDFLLNPGGSAIAKGVSKGFVKGATKGLTTLAGKEGEKLLAKKAMQYTLKATGIGIGAHLGGLAIANTTAVGKTAGQLGTATGGHVVTDDKGSYHVVDKQKLLPALADVERSQAREYGSEMIGEFLPGGKVLKKGITKALEKIGLSKVASTFTNIGTKQWYKQYSKILKAGGYNGIPGEVLEEYEGSLFDALTGHADDAWRDMTSLRNHVDIAFGCASMGVILGTVPMMGAAYHTTLYYGYKHKTDKADKVASSLVGDEKWGAIRDKIDQTENGKMTDVLVGILMDKELNDQAKNATLKYARNLTKMRMYNIANVNCAAEESMNATPQDSHGREAAQRKGTQSVTKSAVERMNASYGMGYNTTDVPSIYDAGVTLKAQENRLSKLLGVDDVRKAMGEDPMAFVEKRKQAGASAEELQAMEDFLVADSAVKGIRQRMADNLDSRLSESDAEMGKRINTEDGMVHKAVMQVRNQDGKEHEVYVLKGNVRMNADGRGVDASSSDNEIYVYDPQEGKTRMMPPSFIERIDEPVDAETVRRATGESIRQDYQSELAKLDTSGLSFQVGDRYDAVDERGIQHRIEVVGGAVDDAGNAMNGYVGVRVDGGEAVSMRTDEIAKMVGNADVQRREAELSGDVSEDGHAVDTEDASDADHAVDVEAAGDVPTYAQNEVLTLLDEHGNPVRAEITAAANEDGLYEVQTDEPIDGKRVSMMSAEEIAAKAPLNPPGRVENEPTKDLQGQEDDTTLEAGESGDVNSALSRIPMDEETQEPRYEEVDADTAWDAIVEQTNGDRALAQEVVDDTVNEMSSGIEKAEKAISKATFKGKGIQERIAFAKDKQERMAALGLEKERLAKWKRIASVERMRAAAVEAEKSRAASAERKARQEEEEKARLAREEAERKEREALNGVPNMTEDKPSDARARGYRRVDGHKVDRQAPVKAVKGKEVQVKFDDKNIPAGHVAVVDASELQPSHIGGQRNAKHFIDEAQPKERKDDASVEAARKIASNIRPEEITTSVTAYTGAPTVNSRGEVIQGNNRSAALKEMWASHPEQGARYKQYLKEHAAEYGLTAEDIDKVQSPVLVNMLDVSDADAIALGQFVASDTESGGTERLKPKNITKKLGDRMKNFSNILLRSSDEESSFSELLDRNGVETLKWLNGIGAITPTQYKSSFDSKGNLTAEAKNDLKGVLYQYVFEGGSTQLEEMFNGLPAKAQRAILSTAYRDYESVKDERMIEEIQDSIMAYHALSQDAQFMSATNHKDARTAVESWKRQYAIDDVTGESYLPSEKFSNFALLLAVMYKGDTQSYIQAKFNAMYDLIQGVREDTLFGTPDNTPRTLAEAINEILNIDYDGQQRSDVLVGGSKVSQARETGSPAGAERGERGAQGDEAAERGRRAAGSSSRRGVGGTYAGQSDLAQTQDLDYKLSDEVDENGQQFVLTSAGELAFGNIGKETGLAPAPILLSEGVITNPKTNAGYGLVHIEARHGEQIRHAGYPSVVAFVEEVAKHYDVIREGVNRSGEQTYMLQLTDSHNNTLMVELSGDGTYYNINTAGIFKTSYGKNRREVYNRHTTANQSTESGEVSQGEAQSGTTSPSRMKSSAPSSKDKDKKSSNTKQANNEKKFEHQEETLFEKEKREKRKELAAVTMWKKQSPTLTDANRENTTPISDLSETSSGGKDTNNLDTKQENEEKVVSQAGEPLSEKENSVSNNTTDTVGTAESGKRNDTATPQNTVSDGKDTEKSSTSKGKEETIAGKVVTDSQGNPLNADGTLKLEKVKSVDDLTDEDFSNPTRSVELPKLPENVDRAIGAESKPVIIKKNILKKNWETHKFPFSESRSILKAALYNTDLVGQTQPTKRPLHWVLIKLDEKSPIVVLEVNENKNNVEIVGWYTLDGRNLDRIKRQAEKNGGELVMLSPKDKVESLSTPQNDLTSVGKDNILDGDLQEKEEKSDENDGVKPFSSDIESALVEEKTNPKEAQESVHAYTIEPTTYTNKKGKTTPMHLVTFGRKLSKDELRAGKELAKESRSWWDKEKGGFMMRSEEAAKELAEKLAKGDEDAVADAQPLSLEDLSTVNDQETVQAIDNAIHVKPKKQTTLQYDYDREDEVRDQVLTGLREALDNGSGIPNIKAIVSHIRDLRKHIKTIDNGLATAGEATAARGFETLAMLTGRLKAYEKFLSDIRKKMQETERDEALAAHGVKLGDKILYKGKEATIHDADAKQVILDTGLGPVLYEVIDWENVELPKSVKDNHKGEEVFTEQKPGSEQPTMQQVDVNGVFSDLYKKGKTKLSDHGTMVVGGIPRSDKGKSEQQFEQSKEETQQEKKAKSKWVDDADAARFEELRQRLHKKLNGQLNMGIDPEAFSIGVEMSYLMLKHGARKFGDFARQMVEALGENVRPYLKSFYNGARDLPEMADYENEMTPYDEVRSFDVMNFDKEGAKDIFATAEHVAREQAVEREAREATKKLKEQRNEQRKEIEQQVAADTEATRSEAETVASEAESKLPSARNEREVNDIAKEIDDAIDKVNDQLAVLGYYKAEPVESDYNEAYGYMRNAERKAVKNVTELYKTLVKELGIQDPVVLDAKGKKQQSVTANIAPSGGDVTMRFMLNRKKGVTLYMNFTLEPDGDNLKLGNIMFRPEKGRDYLRANNYFPADVTLSQMLHGIRSVCEEWLPKEDHVAIAQHVSSKEENEPKKNQPKEIQSNRKSLSSQEKNIPDLFSGLFGDDELKPTSNEQEVHVQSRPGTSEREGGHQREQNELLGASQQHEDERADAERVVGRSGKNTMSNTSGGSRLSELSDGKLDVKPSKSEFAPLADSERKNTHNNHAARGIDYAPKSTNARIEANIKAIETMQRLVESGNSATPEDMSVLRKFSGWGGLGEAFSEMIGGPYGSINPINKRLRELLSPEAYEAANMSRNSAYYTPAPVIDAMWDVARAMGFRGGNVLEGSAGIGNIIGLMPTDMSERSDIHAVEIDETTGNILSLLYPDANVEVEGFEKTFVPNGSVDLAITNVPFVTGLRVMDETGDKDLSRKFHDIHDFCIAKNVRKLKEGGIGIFISSSGTLDSANSAKLRTWLVNDGGADVVGAFRMHNQTFGGTGATSDIIVIRKRVNGKKSVNAIDVSGTLPIRTVKYNTGETKRGSNEVIVKDLALDVNKHFVEHPEDMAGEMAFAFEKGDTYRATSKGLYPSRSINQEQRLSEWAQQFKDMDWDKAEEPKTQQVVYEDLGADVKEGSMLLDGDGNLCLAQRGKAVPLDVNTNKVKGRTKAACFNDYKAIKDALADVLSYQTTHSDDVGLKQKLDVLNKVYDAFVKTYGHLNKNTSIAFLRNDMDYPSIAALESVSETGDKSGKRVVTYGKTDIFSRRVVETESEPKPTTIKDGIIASLYLNGRVDVPYIAKQLGKNESEVREEIIKSGLGFENPTTTEMEVSYEYLSGNVREKLRQAQENNTDGRYDANIKALERVIPMNIPAHLIEFTLGSSWVDPKLYEDFVKERTGIEVKLTNTGGTWLMSEPYWTNTEQNKAMGVISEKCDKTILGHELIKAAITCKSISVTKSVTTGYGSNRTTVTIVDKEATVACANKIDEIRQDFKDWAHGKMQGEAELSERMERVYNELFNNSVPKEIPDEFVPAHFGGAATIVAGHPFQLRPHQAKAVVRATTQPLMLAHEVGTGKTYTLISTAMEMRRLGTARKPMIVVQNATVGQFVASAKALYPNAKILTLEDADRNADGRRNFYAKIRYNDWDMIVVPQSVFERIPDSEERQMRFIEDKVEEKMMVLEKMREAADNDRDPVLRQAERELDQLNDELNNLKLALQERKSGVKSKKDEKREAKSKQNAAVKAQEMLDRETDDVANFDDMGVDALLIDEAHEYKHLGFATAMQRGVKGVDPSYSKKSQGVYLKTQSVLENKNGKNVVFATGTPISNTAAEIWTFMRYLMPADTMREYGIYYFDDFVRNFGNIQQMLEFSTSGKYKENNRFAGYVNLPELVRIWSGIADTVLTREAGGVSDKIPQMDGGQAQDIYLPQTKALRGVMKYVKDQLNEYEKMSGKEKKENSHIPLVMYGIAKAAAVDARLVLEDAVDEPNSKTNEAVRQTLRSLEDTKDYNGTVAIFADNYQNKSTGFNLYEDIRKKLIESGVPKDEIVVMKPGMKVKKKLEIFDKVNRGEVRVIMGSTFTLGTGVNIQERLHTLIHVDAPNRPMDYTQRNGRILRQGNLHNDWGLPVRVLRFGVEDSLDVTAYQRLKTKGAIADSIMEGKKMMNNSMENRVLEEDQDLFGDITAQLSGSQYALLKNQVEKEVRKLEARKKQWEADQTYVHNQKPRLEGLIKDDKERAERNREALAKVEGAKQEGIVIGKQKFATLDAMAGYIKDYNSKQREQQEQVRKASGYNAEAKSSLTMNIGGFDFHVNRVIAKEQKQEKGQLSLSFFSKTQMTYSCPELGLKDVPVDGQRLKSALEDIVNNVMSGNDFRERIEHAERAVERYKGELQQVEARDGKPFEYADELSQAKDKLSEYEELMKAEMAEKEAKYAEMDSEVGAAKNVQLTEEEDTEDDLYREGDDYDGDEDISLSHDPMSKLLGASVYTGAQRKAFGERERKRMAVHVSELSEKLNLKNVDVVTDTSTLSGDRRRAKGFFNKKTGRITIVIPNHTDMADVEKTLLHEAVAHHGLRKLFGDNFDNFLDNVYRNAEYDIRERIAGMASNHGWDVRTATEEYLAGLAEDTNFENMPDGFWSKIKRFFLRMLHSIGFKNLTGVAMGDNELRYVLWRSYENLKEPGRYRNFFAEAADVAKQHQLKVGPYEVSDRADRADVADRADKANKANRANEADTADTANTTDKGDVLYRSGVERTVERVPDIVVSQLYEDAVKDTRDRTLLGALVRTWSKDGRTRFKNKFAESWFDYTRSVKALQDAIAKATGRKVEWFEDVWKSLNAKSSIDEREQEVMSRTLAIPLSRHISSMVSQSGGKYDLDAIEAYLNAKHGLERNELMARRAAEEAAEEAYGSEMEQCRKALAANALDTTAEERLQELTSQYDAMVEESYAGNRRDYAGLTALFDPEKEGKSLAELEDAARKYVSEIEGYYDADTVDALWDKVRALNNFSLKKSYESGLLSKKQYDDISKMYKWYVPLRGWHDNYAGDVYNYVNRGADRGMIENAVKKAYGRTSRAGNILGTMSAMANSAIVVGNKNKVAQVFMNLALNHEDTGLFTISEAWYEKNEADDSWHIVTPDNRIREGMTAEEVADTITQWEDEMREKAANGKALMRSGKFTKDFRHNLEAWKAQQHCVRVSRGGKEYLVYVNGNPKATQAINGLLNPDYQPGIAENILQKYMRHLARVQTSWSPKFVMSNLQRDMLTATGSAYAKHGTGYALEFEKNFAMNTKDIFGLFYKDLHGSLDMGNAKERMFKEFLDNGGKTGISAIGKKQEYEEKYNKSIRRAMHPASSAAMQGAEGIVQGVEFMNSCIENLTRFSTYMTSRQMGKSIKDAIFDAKECSVNFNMKGSGAWGNATLRKYILYTNPALQALRMLNSWYDVNNVRTVGMLASGVAMGFMVAMVNAMCNGGDGDDNAYYGLSDYNRYTYFNIGIGNRKFLHWRLPQEMSPLYALGHISYDLMTERISTERAIQMSLEQLNNYSPLSLIEGNPNYDQSADNTYAKTFLKAITPSYLSPFTDAFLWDEDFLGRSIGNRNEWNKRKPEWQRVDKRTPEWFIKPFEAIGKATGSNGSDREGLTNSPVFNPSAWWYVLMQQGGGLAQVGEQAFNACAVVLGSKDADDVELKDYPLVSTVLVDAGTDNARMRIKNERFWMYRSEYEANKATISNITHSRDLLPVEKAEKISSMQDSRYALMDYFMKKYYKPLREGIAEAEANKDKAETKRLKGMLNEVKGMLLERIEKAEEASPDPSEGGESKPHHNS